MAWRIHDSVIRGEIDNRERGFVRGKLWLKGLEQPIILQLKGNACPDLAGCLLTFDNPGKTFSLPADGKLASLQQGSIGDLTASRKVRVLDMPVAEAYERNKKKLPVPEPMANSLYLEWFSAANGRVVLESADYKLTISPPAWRLTSDEEKQRRHEAAAGFSGFMQKMSDALDAQKHQPPQDKEWDEFDYEKFMRECDARTNKFGELLDKYRDHPDRDRIVAQEMGWTKHERTEEAGESDNPEEQEDDGENPGSELASDLPDLQPNPATEGVDWVRDEFGEPTHPLSQRAFEASVALSEKYDELGLEETEDPDLLAFLGEFQTTGAKLAGALDDLAYGDDLHDGAFVVAYLKRALGHLYSSQAALENAARRKLLPDAVIETNRRELFAIREEILHLMKRFRASGQKD